MDDEVTATLTRRQWETVIGLARWAFSELDEGTGTEEERRGRELLASLRSQVGPEPADSGDRDA